ncbi:MAG: hypothetical protein LH606_16165 [Cytophagaceae bacterium]|nr:hypothetical protein [Cytophagaceae bacterium]
MISPAPLLPQFRTWLGFLLILSQLTACRIIALYDPFAYQQSTALKVEALDLMDKATEPFSSHETEINIFLQKARKAHEYEKFRPKNGESAGMWALLLNPEENLLAGFMNRWKAKGQLDATFVKLARDQSVMAFDKLIRLESAKLKVKE